jgi:hypothetical protein
MRHILWTVAGMLLLSGFGCTNPLVVNEKLPTDIGMGAGTTLVLEATMAGFDNPLVTNDVTSVSVAEWSDTSAKVSWTRVLQQETEASKKARNAALSSPVGTNIPVPEMQYEEVTLSGTLSTDGMGNGTHLEAPVFWEQGDVSKQSEGNSLIWLSRGQYESLISTRHATVTFGKLDALITTLTSYYNSASSLVDKLNGSEAASPATENISSLTTLTAEADWGSYEFLYGTEKVKVQTVIAENAFARFEILANPENPLVLSITPRPTSWLTVALETLHVENALEGYKVTQISPSSEDQPQPAVQ